MKKVIYSALSLLMFCEHLCMPTSASQPQGSSSANTASTSHKKRIGIGLAVEYMNSDTNLTIVPDRSLGIAGTTQSQVAKKALLALCGEFGATFSQEYYLGIFISGRYAGASNGAQTPIFMTNYFSHTFRINYFADLFLKPGYKFTPKFMFYGLIGPTVMSWKHTSDHMRNTSLRNTLDIKRTSYGLGLGFGFEYMAKDNCAVSLDYIQHFFGTSIKSTSISYRNPAMPVGLDTNSGNVIKKVQPSFSTIAARMTIFFNL